MNPIRDMKNNFLMKLDACMRNIMPYFSPQVHLKDKDRYLVLAFNQELNDVRQLYAEGHLEPPPHANMPPIVSKLMWVRALKERISVRMIYKR